MNVRKERRIKSPVERQFMGPKDRAPFPQIDFLGEKVEPSNLQLVEKFPHWNPSEECAIYPDTSVKLAAHNAAMTRIGELYPPAAAGSVDAPRCVCGEPLALGTVHRTDGPCYVPDTTPQQPERMPAGEAVDGTWLWCEMMDWCKKRGVPPANYNDLFAIVSKARATVAADADAVRDAALEDAARSVDEQAECVEDGDTLVMAAANIRALKSCAAMQATGGEGGK